MLWSILLLFRGFLDMTSIEIEWCGRNLVLRMKQLAYVSSFIFHFSRLDWQSWKWKRRNWRDFEKPRVKKRKRQLICWERRERSRRKLKLYRKRKYGENKKSKQSECVLQFTLRHQRDTYIYQCFCQKIIRLSLVCVCSIYTHRFLQCQDNTSGIHPEYHFREIALTIKNSVLNVQGVCPACELIYYLVYM